MENSGIEWTDHTFNPVIGCMKVSDGCKNCYAEDMMDHRYRKVVWGPHGTRMKTSESNWKKPLKWNRMCDSDSPFTQCVFCGHRGHVLESGFCPGCGDPEGISARPRVFCASLSDVFEDWDGPIHNHDQKHLVHGEHGYIPEDNEQAESCSMVTMDDIRCDLFKLIDATPNLDWLLLTKRPENIRKMWPATQYDPQSGMCNHGDGHRENVWLGCTVENQEQADKRIPELLECRNLAPVLFLSCEPLLGEVDLLRGVYAMEHPGGLDWVIAGGESGPSARPSHPEWFRSLREQCEVSRIPFLFKQWGEFTSVDEAIKGDLLSTYENKYKPYDTSTGTPMAKVGKKKAGRILDGQAHDEFPHPTDDGTIAPT